MSRSFGRGSNFSRGGSSGNWRYEWTIDINPLEKISHEHFAGLNLTGKDVEVHEIGYYSLQLNSGPTEPELHPDKRSLRSVAIPQDSMSTTTERGSVLVNFDLNAGFDEYESTRVGWRYIDYGTHDFFQWLRFRAGDVKAREFRECTDLSIICSKPLLEHLARIPYNQHAWHATHWIFGASKIGNNIVIGQIQREGIDMIHKQNPHQQNPHQQNLPDNYYRGRRFEEFITVQSSEGAEDNSNGQVEGSRFHSVVQVRLNNIKIMMDAAIDAQDSSEKYVDLATVQRSAVNSDVPKTFYLGRLIQWWTMNIFVGVKTIFAGIYQDNIISEVRSYQVAEIPDIVKRKENELKQKRANGTTLWDEKVCLGFVYELLRFVINKVTEDHTKAVYEFSCPKNGTEGFSCERIQKEKAEGHNYIPSDVPEQSNFF